MRTTIWMAFWIFLLDQASKWAVVHWLNLRTFGVMDVWPPYLTFRMAWNHGINFGLFANQTDTMQYVLIAIAVVIIGWVLWWMRNPAHRRLAHLSAGLLVGGALGNVVDRWLYGAVADFLNVSCCGIENPFAFNVADIAVFGGALGLVFFADGKKAA
ncbi:MAG: signal peptidase II [Paracoccaceae bacterium]